MNNQNKPSDDQVIKSLLLKDVAAAAPVANTVAVKNAPAPKAAELLEDAGADVPADAAPVDQMAENAVTDEEVEAEGGLSGLFGGLALVDPLTGLAVAGGVGIAAAIRSNNNDDSSTSGPSDMPSMGTGLAALPVIGQALPAQVTSAVDSSPLGAPVAMLTGALSAGPAMLASQTAGTPLAPLGEALSGGLPMPGGSAPSASVLTDPLVSALSGTPLAPVAMAIDSALSGGLPMPGGATPSASTLTDPLVSGAAGTPLEPLAAAFANALSGGLPMPGGLPVPGGALPTSLGEGAEMLIAPAAGTPLAGPLELITSAITQPLDALLFGSGTPSLPISSSALPMNPITSQLPL